MTLLHEAEHFLLTQLVGLPHYYTVPVHVLGAFSRRAACNILSLTAPASVSRRCTCLPC
jgi:hypothetical protein